MSAASRLTTSRLLACLLLTGILAPSAVPAAAQAKEAEPHRKVVNRIAPTYPDLARRTHIEGRVRLLAVIAPSGNVKSSKVLGGNPVLARAAEEAVSRWKFSAASEETEEVIELKFGQD